LLHVGLTHFFNCKRSFILIWNLRRGNQEKTRLWFLMGIELILEFGKHQILSRSRDTGNFGLNGQVIALFVIILAAAEAAIALAIVLNIYKTFSNVNIDEIDHLKE